MYDTCSCVGNYSCTKEKGITFWLTFVHLIKQGKYYQIDFSLQEKKGKLGFVMSNMELVAYNSDTPKHYYIFYSKFEILPT